MNPRKIALTLPLILFVSMSFKCDSGGSTAARSKTAELQRNYLKAVDDFGRSISVMADLKRKLGQEGRITPAEELRLTDELLKVNTAAKMIAAQGPLAPSLPTLKSSLNELSQAILAIQDTRSKSQFQAITQNLQASSEFITNISGIVAGKCSDVGGGCVICRGDPCTYCPRVPPICP